MAPLTLITTLPHFVLPAEHEEIVSSTPASFSDIPTVLRHKEENVSVTLDPPLEGLSAEDCSDGTLYVIESVLAFMSPSGRGFQVEYPTITLHAISRAESGPSIYCQLEEQSADAAQSEGDEEVSEFKELSILPKDPESLETIFEALSLCASLHPDPATADDMDDDNNAFFDGDFETFNGDENEELSEVGRVRSDFANNNRYAPY